MGLETGGPISQANISLARSGEWARCGDGKRWMAASAQGRVGCMLLWMRVCVCVGIRLSLCVYACVGDEAEQDWIHKSNANKTETRMRSVREAGQD